MDLHIGVVHWAFPPVTGGVEMHLLTICPEMQKQGAEVTVLCGNVEGDQRTDVVEGITVLRRPELVPANLDADRDKDRDIYGPAKKLFDEFLDAHDIDVVQAHNLHMDFYDISKALQDACVERGIPRYLVLHNDVFIDRSDSRTKRIVRDIKWERLVPISDYIRDVMTEAMPEIPEDRWAVIKHGINTDRQKPATQQEKADLKAEYGFEGRPVILHPGRFLPWKGILPAIRSMPLILNEVPNALMVMTGRASRLYKNAEELKEYNEKIDDYVSAHDLETFVHIGRYDYHDIPRLEALSDLVIYTTIGEEPFGLVPVEGMACGVPVVVTRSGGMVESVVDGETGYIITPDADRLPLELAQRAVQILQDPALAAKMGRNGRQRVLEKFDKERMARDFIVLSEQLQEEELRP